MANDPLISARGDAGSGDRPVITVKEAAKLYHVGEKKLRAIIKEAPTLDWILHNGRYSYIKRRLFEEFLFRHNSVSEIN